MIRTLLILAAFVAVSHAYSTGSGLCVVNPTDSTFTGQMGSLTQAQWAANGRNFTSRSTYTPNGQLTITIISPTTFKGLLIYAVDSTGTKVGSFVTSSYFQVMGVSGTGTPSCGGSTTFTHIDATEKANGTTIVFNAPAAGTGAIYFRGMMAHAQTSQWHVIDDHVVYEGASVAVSSSSSSSSSTGLNSGSVVTPLANMIAVAIAFISTIVAIVRW